MQGLLASGLRWTRSSSPIRPRPLKCCKVHSFSTHPPADLSRGRFVELLVRLGPSGSITIELGMVSYIHSSSIQQNKNYSTQLIPVSPRVPVAPSAGRRAPSARSAWPRASSDPTQLIPQKTTAPAFQGPLLANRGSPGRRGLPCDGCSRVLLDAEGAEVPGAHVIKSPPGGHVLRLPLKNCSQALGKLGDILWEDVPVMLPWHTLSVMAHKGVSYLDRVMCGAADGSQFRQQYWNNGKRGGWFYHHPISRIPEEELHTCYPIYFFGDETKTFNSMGLDACFCICSFSGCGGRGVSRSHKHFLLQLPSWRSVEATNVELSKFFAWMLVHLEQGRRPSVGYYGEPMDPFMKLPILPRIFLGGIKSDWLHRVKMHCLPRKPNALLICEFCLAAKRGPCTYADMSEDAAWLRTQFTHTGFMVGCSSPWFRHLERHGLRLGRHFWDGLHLFYKAGVASDLIGSTLCEWAELEQLDASAGEDPDLQLRSLFAQFQRWLSENSISSHHMASWSLQRLHRKSRRKFPSVTDNYKCGDVKSMLYWIEVKSRQLLLTAERAGVALSDYARVRHTCIVSLTGYVSCIGLAGPMLTDAERVEARDCLLRFLRTYPWLANVNVLRGRALFGIRPKFHGVQHLAVGLASGDCENPRCWETWGEETLGGFVSSVTKRCHSTTAMLRAAQRCVGCLLADL